MLALQRAAYAELAQTAAIMQGRFTRSEVKYLSTINVAEIQKRADELGEELPRPRRARSGAQLANRSSRVTDAVGSRREIEASTNRHWLSWIKL